jgi:mono/diheme cytochrome c family protein
MCSLFITGANLVDSRLFRTIIAALVLACAARIVIAAQGNPEAAKVKNPVASTPESIAAGKVVYAKCAPCHGINGEGGPGNDLIPPAPSLVDDMWDHGSTDGEIFDNVKNGIGPDFNMVPWKDQLKDEQIWSVVNYVRSIAKKK